MGGIRGHMATTINNPVSNQSPDNNALNKVMARAFVLDWYVILFTIIFLFAMFTRFYDLGARLMSHDESLHTQFSYNLSTDGNFEHTPLMHGPILFHMTALSYTLFGDNDFTSRIYSAVVGVMIVMSPLLFRRWLGRWGTILAATMLLISPLMMYYSRYIRHDMPSIMSAILMAASVFFYLNGPVEHRRKAFWLYVLSGAIIWNLGSKETAFIYVAIFGAFLTLYWLVRVAQYFYNINGKPVFYTITIGFLLAVFASLLMILVMSIGLGNIGVAGSTLAERTTFIGNEVGNLLTGDSVTTDFSTFMRWTALTVVVIVSVLVGPALWAYRKRVYSFSWVDLSALLLMVLTFFVLGSLDSLGFGLIGTILVGIAYAWFRLGGKRSFGRQVATILVITTLICGGLLIVEELSHESSRTSSESIPEQQPIPGEGGEELVVVESDFSMLPIAVEWVAAIAIILALLYSQQTRFWEILNLFPEFDILLLMGSLILPWLTAVFIFATHGTDADFIALAQNLPDFVRSLVPTGAVSPGQEVLRTGQVIVGLLAWIPMMTIAVVTGLMWNWRRWIVCFAIFHAIFAFFFTTVFTNIEGLASGMIYSLQYWLEQQGERRGSQPQYYYMVVIMPFYEFLPIIGGFFAMLAGMVFFWRKRRAFDAESVAIIDETASDYEPVEDNTETLPSAIFGLAFGAIALMSFAAFAFVLSQLNMSDIVNQDGVIIQEADSPYLAIILFIVFVVNTLSGLLWLGRFFHVESASSTISDNDYGALEAENGDVAPVLVTNDYVNEGSIDDEFSDGGDALVKRKRGQLAVDPRWQLREVPFTMFVAWWAVFNIFAYTLSGEKMPWLGTHMTVPLIFLSAWYFGPIIEKIDLGKFLKQGWMYLLLFPLLMVVLFQIIGPLAGTNPPFQGVARNQLQATYTWFGMLVVASAIVYVILRLVQETGWAHLRRMFTASAFILLSILTFRSAWMASFINYDEATEFLVYAHAGPGNGIVYDHLRELSLLTTGGMDIAYAYDDGMSWPGSWYFREFTYPSAYFGSNPTLQRLDGVVAVAVRGDGLPEVQPLLEADYQQFDYIRMWWPMQGYYNLNAQRMNHVLDFFSGDLDSAGRRHGIWDIWWQRDYTRFGQVTGEDFSLTNWPVSDRVYLFVRRDVAAQVWPYGIGEGVAFGDTDNQQTCLTTWEPREASVVFDSASAGVFRPIGLDVGPDGLVYVADEGNAGAGIQPRIHVFTPDGEWVESIGEQGAASQPGAYFERPHSVAFGPDGTMYVADTWNYLIRRFAVTDSGYDYLDSWGEPFSAGLGAPVEPVEGLWGPRDVTVDQLGNVYVADTGNKRVRVYNSEGEYLLDIGEGGSLSGQLDEPAGIVVHPDGRVFVADTWNRRISVFTSDGFALTTFPIRGWLSEPNNRPYLALDVTRDMLYITDPDAGRVFMYDTQGNCLGSFGQLNVDLPTNSQFSGIGGITVDDAGNVFVADLLSGRILRFDPWNPPIVIPAVPEDDNSEGLELEATEELMPEFTPELTEEPIIELEVTSEVTDELETEETIEVTDELESETNPETTSEVDTSDDDSNE